MDLQEVNTTTAQIQGKKPTTLPVLETVYSSTSTVYIICVCTGNYSCFDGGGCVNDTVWTPYTAVLDSITVALLSPTCYSTESNHPYFHFSHAIMFICYMLPFGSPCQLVLLIRIGLAGATTIMALWAKSLDCWVVSLLWNAASAVVNIIHICVLFYQLRPIKFNDELEQVKYTFLTKYLIIT